MKLQQIKERKITPLIVNPNKGTIIILMYFPLTLFHLFMDF